MIKTNLLIILVLLLIILYVHGMYFKEGFEKITNSNVKILVFVSKSCGHCVNYNNNVHNKVEELAKQKGWDLKRIFSDNDPENLFSKYNVMYIPACFIIKNDVTKQLSGSITLENIENTIKNM